ncbi:MULTISPECIES: ribose-phosphate diphosphokinase [unclassified Candidatus Frackibacter]|uniref:ribose-phosphate diphosphokinase n=1 Tax=unclassified Candidatus Frackibacter TaxID=2648818 RepID=UPI000795643B|nr:MAG: ribose-phosphate pyrophosphokinase [Candidatus Frackibacter sp. T328-2]SDC66340.1 ribose-phosphate pyrophosphokinase [Candidatus Frackibacter sp. WG11]SEM79504.1 ribose-phosphate pyrophosphokinase [Candidatus Frackibacter sp. WG12]SFL90210.1 ribose-phosphate pyrophosphokinase [Candidatus Frackibacter sp. WG13]
MGMNKERLKVFTGNSNPELAEEICDYLGTSLVHSKVSRFSDGEIGVSIEESIRGSDVFVVQPTSAPVNENIMELLIMVDALKRASARSITAVVPYFGYARQDRKAKPRDPISAKLISNLLASAGADRLVCLDLHAAQIQGFFDIPVDHLLGAPILAEYFLNKDLEDTIVVAPDVGAVKRARDFAERLNTSIAIIDKRRPKPNVSEVMNIIGNVKGKNVILLDDMIDTAGTITEAGRVLQEKGAEEVYACCTHPVFSGPAIERLENSTLKEVVVTNTIALSDEKQLDKVKILSIAPLLGEALDRIFKDLSVSVLFD